MADSDEIFRRVGEVIYYQRTSKFTGEIVPGIWERTELVNRLGVDRVEVLERWNVIGPPY